MADVHTLDKQKYIRILESDGISAALTALHRDMDDLEVNTFESLDGFKEEYWDYVQAVREFSRDLWNYPLTGRSPQAK